MNNDNHNIIAIYKTNNGGININVKIENKTAWLTQIQIAELFETTKPNISMHIKNIYDNMELQDLATVKKILTVQKEGNREVKRELEFYNLDMIIAIGYRVNSKQAAQFRIWATNILKEYMIKGFVLDDDRLKYDKNTPIDELIEKIRDIRASELNFYQKVRDLLRLSSDYRANDRETNLFFANIQNKLIYAITNKTAGEIIFERANHKDINMGLTSFRGDVVRLVDIYISKNYLEENEIKDLNNLTTMFLDYVENQVQRTQKQLFMNDWENKTDSFVAFNEYNTLNGFGKISKTDADNKARTEYNIYDGERKNLIKKNADLEDLVEIEKNYKGEKI